MQGVFAECWKHFCNKILGLWRVDLPWAWASVEPLQEILFDIHKHLPLNNLRRLNRHRFLPTFGQDQANYRLLAWRDPVEKNGQIVENCHRFLWTSGLEQGQGMRGPHRGIGWRSSDSGGSGG